MTTMDQDGFLVECSDEEVEKEFTKTAYGEGDVRLIKLFDDNCFCVRPGGTTCLVFDYNYFTIL